MSTANTINRRINEITSEGVEPMPYQAMLRQLREQLDRTTKEKDRSELEFRIVMLLGLISIQKGISQMVRALDHKSIE